MIPIKKFNYITGDASSITYGVNRIVDFLELEGRNVLLICREKNYSSTGINYLVNNKKEFTDTQSFRDIIEDKGNLFRVDLIVLDFWNLSVSTIIEYLKILENLSVEFIILAKEYHYKSSDDVCDYHISQESGMRLHSNEFIITDKISGWSSNLSELKKSYIRDKKIEEIFNKPK